MVFFILLPLLQEENRFVYYSVFPFFIGEISIVIAFGVYSFRFSPLGEGGSISMFYPVC